MDLVDLVHPIPPGSAAGLIGTSCLLENSANQSSGVDLFGLKGGIKSRSPGNSFVTERLLLRYGKTKFGPIRIRKALVWINSSSKVEYR